MAENRYYLPILLNMNLNQNLKFEKIDMFYNQVPVLRKGEPIESNKSQWKEIVSNRTFNITVDLNLGDGNAEIWTNDLSEEYVNFNKSE